MCCHDVLRCGIPLSTLLDKHFTDPVHKHNLECRLQEPRGGWVSAPGKTGAIIHNNVKEYASLPSVKCLSLCSSLISANMTVSHVVVRDCIENNINDVYTVVLTEGRQMTLKTPDWTPTQYPHPPMLSLSCPLLCYNLHLLEVSKLSGVRVRAGRDSTVTWQKC